MSPIKRSVYSIVLMDDVIKAIDQMAYQINTSRSNLINQILAEKVMLTTPEMRMKDIFDKVASTIEDDKKFKVQLQPSDYCISIFSSLNYRYNPTIRYFVELYRTHDDLIGELKITSRTQSIQLQDHLSQFFKYFLNLERSYLVKAFPRQTLPKLMTDNNGRLTRELILLNSSHHPTTDVIAQGIGNYVQMIDQLLTTYLNHVSDTGTGLSKMEQQYIHFLNTDPLLL